MRMKIKKSFERITLIALACIMMFVSVVGSFGKAKATTIVVPYVVEGFFDLIVLSGVSAAGGIAIDENTGGGGTVQMDNALRKMLYKTSETDKPAPIITVDGDKIILKSGEYQATEELAAQIERGMKNDPKTKELIKRTLEQLKANNGQVSNKDLAKVYQLMAGMQLEGMSQERVKNLETKMSNPSFVNCVQNLLYSNWDATTKGLYNTGEYPYYMMLVKSDVSGTKYTTNYVYLSKTPFLAAYSAPGSNFMYFGSADTVWNYGGVRHTSMKVDAMGYYDYKTSTSPFGMTMTDVDVTQSVIFTNELIGYSSLNVMPFPYELTDAGAYVGVPDISKDIGTYPGNAINYPDGVQDYSGALDKIIENGRINNEALNELLGALTKGQITDIPDEDTSVSGFARYTYGC